MIQRYTSNELDKLVEILKNDGVISVPTDTVYGLCARISSKDAYNKLIKVKNRPMIKPFPVMCANKEQIKSIAEVNDTVSKLIEKFMPGPITLVIDKKKLLPDYITNGKDNIAIRMAATKDLEKIIGDLNEPVFMTSANKSGESTCDSLDKIEEMCPEIDGMLEGNVLFSRGSTIVDCSDNKLEILREGPISIDQINEVINSKDL